MKCPKSKHQFRYRIDAIQANKAIGKWTGEYFNIYRCQWCNDFHLASRRNGLIKRKKKPKY